MDVKKIRRENAMLVVVDFQEKLLPAMKGCEELTKRVVKLIKGCRLMGVPAVVTQQYTKGLGKTVREIHEALGEYEPIEKTSFSALGEPAFIEALEKTDRRSVILTGIESHVCVQQTALDLLERGYHVFLVNDCIASRSNNDKKYAQRRIAESGAVGTTYEAVLFELCMDAGDPIFREISAIVK